jgi:predicted PurR-regulated permease PerM
MNQQADKSLWDLRAVRELLILLCVLAVVYVAYRIRATLAPIGFAFLLSYVVEPPVRFLRERCRVPRGASAALSLLLFITGIGVFWTWAGPKLADQANELVDKLPEYAEVLRDRLGIEAESVDDFVESFKDGKSKDVRRAMQLSDLLVAGTQRMFGFVGTIAAGTLYVVFAFFVVIVFFVLFVTYKGWGKHVEWVVPRNHHDAVRKVAGYMDRALGAYVRGQLLVALFTFTGFSVGFFFADVPYWFVVALIGGTCSLIPYGQVLGPLVAIALKLLESQVGEAAFSWWGVLLAPLLVYGITQSLESWVITPLVQGEVNKLHPAVIVTVLILGGSIAGILGLILAIPITATVKASLREFVFDQGQNHADQQSNRNG